MTQTTQNASSPIDTLVVEHDNDVRAVLVSLLKRSGRSVIGVRTVGEALLTWQPSMRLVVTGIVLADGYGTLLANTILRMSPATRFLFATGLPRPFWPEPAADALGQLPSSAHLVLPMPFRLSELKDAVSALCPAAAAMVPAPVLHQRFMTAPQIAQR